MRTCPDYRWPDSFLAWHRAPVRWVMAGLFYLGYALGRTMQVLKGSFARSLLVIRTDGLGDAVLFEPALASLAERFVEHRVHLWAPRPVCELFRASPYVDRLKWIPRGCKEGNLRYFWSGFLRAYMGYLIGRWSFERVIYPAESAEPMGNWLMSSVRAADRWIVEGDTENQFNWQKERAISRATRILWRRLGGGHELLRNAHLAAQWGADIRSRRPRIYVADDAAQVGCGRARHWHAIAQQAGAEGIVGIVPAGTLASKRYPVESWAKVIRTLWQQHRLMPAFLGTGDEASVIGEIRSQIQDIPLLDLDDRLEVLALAALLARLDAVIGVDTGTIHLALAQQVPTVVLRTGAHAGRFIPWPNATGAKVLPQHLAADSHRAGPSGEAWIASIHPAEVVEACLEVSGRRPRMRIAV